MKTQSDMRPTDLTLPELIRAYIKSFDREFHTPEQVTLRERISHALHTDSAR